MPIKKEAKIITHLSEYEIGADVHIVKEMLHNEDGTYEDNIKIIEDFKRPFWVTKQAYQTYTDKKEAEEIDKLNKFLSTESDLYRNISIRLGDRYIGIKNPRYLKQSPFLYGSDIDSRTILKYLYTKKNNETSKYRIGVFDIEVDTLLNKIIIISLVTYKKLRVVILKSFADKIPNLKQRILEGYDKHIPETSFKSDVRKDIEIKIFNTEIELIKYIFKEANYANIDFLTGWNIKYDITEILNRLEEKNIEPADIFHYDKIPSKYKYFKFREGRSKKITEAGREIPMAPEEQWHTVKSTTNYYFIDAMSSHRYVRVGGATVPGGYSLNNILEKEKVTGKLKFDSNQGHKGIEWHIYMVEKKPLEYILYNIWDVMSILELDSKTKDLSISVPLLSSINHFDIFNSGPKKLVNAMFFFYLKHKMVLGVKDPTEKNDKILGLDSWVITLNAYLRENNGLKCIYEDPTLTTNILTHVSDLDVTSAYPSATCAGNVSKDTTHREIVKIENMTKEEFMIHNINIMFSNTNSLEYAQQMFKMPSLYNLL